MRNNFGSLSISTYSDHSSNFFLKAIAKSKKRQIALAFKSDEKRQLLRKQTKSEENKRRAINSNNAIAIFSSPVIILHF